MLLMGFVGGVIMESNACPRTIRLYLSGLAVPWFETPVGTERSGWVEGYLITGEKILKNACTKIVYYLNSWLKLGGPICTFSGQPSA